MVRCCLVKMKYFVITLVILLLEVSLNSGHAIFKIEINEKSSEQKLALKEITDHYAAKSSVSENSETQKVAFKELPDDADKPSVNENEKIALEEVTDRDSRNPSIKDSENENLTSEEPNKEEIIPDDADTPSQNDLDIPDAPVLPELDYVEILISTEKPVKQNETTEELSLAKKINDDAAGKPSENNLELVEPRAIYPIGDLAEINYGEGSKALNRKGRSSLPIDIDDLLESFFSPGNRPGDSVDIIDTYNSDELDKIIDDLEKSLFGNYNNTSNEDIGSEVDDILDRLENILNDIVGNIHSSVDRKPNNDMDIIDEDKATDDKTSPIDIQELMKNEIEPLIKQEVEKQIKEYLESNKNDTEPTLDQDKDENNDNDDGKPLDNGDDTNEAENTKDEPDTTKQPSKEENDINTNEAFLEEINKILAKNVEDIMKLLSGSTDIPKETNEPTSQEVDKSEDSNDSTNTNETVADEPKADESPENDASGSNENNVEPATPDENTDSTAESDANSTENSTSE